MKIRLGFVSNSSSSSFMIKNLSSKYQTLLEFAKENLGLLADFNNLYSESITMKDFLRSAENDYPDIEWKPQELKYCCFGDEDYTVLGKVFDYILRNGGESKNFKWIMNECRGESYDVDHFIRENRILEAEDEENKNEDDFLICGNCYHLKETDNNEGPSGPCKWHEENFTPPILRYLRLYSIGGNADVNKKSKGCSFWKNKYLERRIEKDV